MNRLIRRARARVHTSLRLQFHGALGLMLVPLVVVGATGWAFLHQSSTAFQTVSSQVAAESQAMDRLRELMGQTHQLAQGYVTQRDAGARAQFRRIGSQIEAGFAELQTLYAEHDAAMGPARREWQAARSSAERAFAAKVLPADDPTAEYPLFTFHKLADGASGSLGAEQAAGFRRLEAEAAGAHRQKQVELGLLLGVFLLSVAAALLLARRLGRAVTLPLARLGEAATRLGDDDLSARVRVDRRDELGRAAETFNLMADRLVESRESRAQLEEQLRQAQKLEAVGRLAGGIAHDFNNLLLAIKGNCELLADRRSTDPENDLVGPEVTEIGKAADRAVALTGQLLAFSRKQVLQTDVLDPNLLVAEISSLLERVIGEDVELRTVLEPDLGRIEADASQIEQILMNLAINARDAMPNGGKLTIETANVTLDESYARTHADASPGEYVMLAASDTGHGMDAETRDRIFEPFFTTKDVGKGTGLGLATVYGIVKQSGGSLYVYSEPGRGTTFKIYLPRTDEQAPAARNAAPDQVHGGSETILLVEDEDIVARMVARMLEQYGYRVLAASNGDEALAVASDAHAIDLLITDVVMPGMSGPELAGRLATMVPRLKVIYTSGYTDEGIVHHGVLDRDVAFPQKPFTMVDLDRKVRDVIAAAA